MFSVVYILLENPKALTGSPFGKNLVYFVFWGGGVFSHKTDIPNMLFLKNFEMGREVGKQTSSEKNFNFLYSYI